MAENQNLEETLDTTSNEQVVETEQVEKVENKEEKTSKKQKEVKEVKNSKKSTKKEKKQNKLAKKLRETGSELKKVSWPSFKTVVKQTGVVLVVVVVFLIVLFGIDRLLSLLFDWFVSLLG